MRTKSWSITIGASKPKIWRTLWDDATYRQWTSPFSEGSYAVTDWQEGSKVLFLGEDGGGLVGRIAEHRPNEFLSIEHLGEVKNGIEDTSSEAINAWAGAKENYTLSGVDGAVTLKVDLDLTEQHEAMFDEIWPKALAKVRELAEG
jgi:uncharacterized protein YndB with AHSA1/START domain